MIDDADTWNRLAALLPEAGAREVRDCWEIGEQEAGLGLLVSGLLAHRVPISETVRARISVLAEDWGEREALTPRIPRCRGDGGVSTVRLIEQEGGSAGGPTAGAGPGPAGYVLLPWIACDGCGRVLLRAHDRQRWGGLSFSARHYAITSPDRATVLRTLPAGAAGEAFDVLLRECDGPPAAVGPGDAAPRGAEPQDGPRGRRATSGRG
ncbi:hypothetical protein ACLIYM_02155 [Streptomyces fenghuangensis]